MSRRKTLPPASIGRLMGLLETMRETTGPDDVYRLAGALQLELDELLPLLDAAKLLGLAFVSGGDYELTAEGRSLTDGDERIRKQIFRAHAGKIPVLRKIVEMLAASEDERMPRELIVEQVSERLSEAEVERHLQTAIDWGRYGELFDYDARTQEFIRV